MALDPLVSYHQREFDDSFPRITASLLGDLYPHLIDAVPSMSVAQFGVDPNLGKHTSLYRLYKWRLNWRLHLPVAQVNLYPDFSNS